MLARHFNIEIVVVSLDGLVLRYNGDAPGITGTGYLLYTGQHYDVIVGAMHKDAAVDDEVRLFPPVRPLDALHNYAGRHTHPDLQATFATIFHAAV